jgi:hypothetical protein
MQHRLVAYLAGPYRSKDGPSGIYQNIHEARMVAIELWQQGFAVVCPHCNTAFFDGAAPDEVWLDGDIAILRKCDLLVAMPRYLESQGARAEVAAAQLANISVYYWPGDKEVLRRMAQGVAACPA